jgi:septal ring factor EnvC (AmiA/AmiB activator)
VGKKTIDKTVQRRDIEAALGRKMHEISLQQEICLSVNKKLKELQDAANDLDGQLREFDGK